METGSLKPPSSERSLLERIAGEVRRLGRKRWGPTLRALRDDDALILRWWRTIPNWGDAVNPVLVREIAGVEPIAHDEVVNLGNRPVYSMVGSVLDGAMVPNLVVWGSGFMHADSSFRVPPRAVHAVRGPLTRELVREQGIECPPVYGDPALLYPRFYAPEVEPEFDLGMVPHFQDRGSPKLERFRRDDDVLVIDVLSGVRDVVDQICRCRGIASSSLHGLVAADAYGVPCVWMEISDRVRGGGFKFRDYFASVNRRDRRPVRVDEETTAGDLIGGLDDRSIDIDLELLLERCPFPVENRGEPARASGPPEEEGTGGRRRRG